jgi:hypothetical protein
MLESLSAPCDSSALKARKSRHLNAVREVTATARWVLWDFGSPLRQHGYQAGYNRERPIRDDHRFSAFASASLSG